MKLSLYRVRIPLANPNLKIFAIFFFIVIVGSSCENQDNDFPDFDYTTGYFPYQYPVRTLVLGNYIYDNENDNQHKFVISTTMGGVYENKSNRIFNFTIDERLCEKAYFEDGSAIRPLPKEYYELSNNSQIIIPSGKLSGGVEVRLSDSFFDDPLTIRNTYVLPLRINSAENLDSLLSGRPVRENPDPRISSHWTISPKDFTLFAIKYVNPYHGSYLRRGSSEVFQGGIVVEDSIYQADYIERDEVLNLTTTSKTKVVFSTTFKSNLLTGFVNIELDFASPKVSEEVACTISAAEGELHSITGTGRYMMNTEEFGNKARDAIYIEYTVDAGSYSYTASDILVFRDKGVQLETFVPEIKE